MESSRNIGRKLVRSKRAGTIEEESMPSWGEYYNYRDSADSVGEPIAAGVLFRGCSPHGYQQNKEFLELVRQAQIETRIDLRAERERDAKPVSIAGIRTVEAKIDPYKVYGEMNGFWDKDGLIERVYGFIAWQNAGALQQTVAAIEETTGGVLIHCEGGRDRTGIFVAFLQLLAGATRDQVLRGFSVNTDEERVQIFARILNVFGEDTGQQLAIRMAISSEHIRKLGERLTRSCY
jgi:protein tyrosine/serine phosphatase